jgi:hypothetical protein
VVSLCKTDTIFEKPLIFEDQWENPDDIKISKMYMIGGKRNDSWTRNNIKSSSHLYELKIIWND